MPASEEDLRRELAQLNNDDTVNRAREKLRRADAIRAGDFDKPSNWPRNAAIALAAIGAALMWVTYALGVTRDDAVGVAVASVGAIMLVVVCPVVRIAGAAIRNRAIRSTQEELLAELEPSEEERLAWEEYKSTSQRLSEMSGSHTARAEQSKAVPHARHMSNAPSVREVPGGHGSTYEPVSEEAKAARAVRQERLLKEARRGKTVMSRGDARQANKRNPTICPQCGSHDTMVLGSGKKVALGRAIVGDLVAGPIGAGVGAMTGKRNRVEMVCRSCGRRWYI
ncbi:hypothetical protein [Olsenella uli]